MGAVNLFTAAVETTVFIIGGDGAYGPFLTVWEKYGRIGNEGLGKKRSLNQIGHHNEAPALETTLNYYRSSTKTSEQRIPISNCCFFKRVSGRKVYQYVKCRMS